MPQVFLDEFDERPGDDDVELPEQGPESFYGDVHHGEQRREHDDGRKDGEDEIEGHRRRGIGTVVVIGAAHSPGEDIPNPTPT